LSVQSAPEIRIGLGTCGVASGAEAVQGAALHAASKLGAPVKIKTVGCAGMCHLEPLIEIVESDGKSSFYGRVPPGAVPNIVARHFSPPRL